MTRASPQMTSCMVRPRLCLWAGILGMPGMHSLLEASLTSLSRTALARYSSLARWCIGAAGARQTQGQEHVGLHFGAVRPLQCSLDRYMWIHGMV